MNSFSGAEAKSNNGKCVCTAEDCDPESPNLTDLPIDILLTIFSFCGIKWWPTLARVCVRFSVILGPNSRLWEQMARKLLIVNEESNIVKSRRFGRLSSIERCRIYNNWRSGYCIIKPVKTIPEKHVLPWLVLESDKLWIGARNYIKAYPRSPPLALSSKPYPKKSNPVKELVTLASPSGDFGRFVTRGDILVSGTTNGTLLVWRSKSGRLQFKKPHCHSFEISCVGVHNKIIVSGSLDRTVKIWKHSWRNLWFSQSISLGDRVLSLDIDPTGSTLCTGTAGHYNVPPSQLHDLATGVSISPLRSHFREGEGVYDVHFESASEVLTADFNSALRLWDIRTRANVSVWEDPHDSAVNCIASDNKFTIFTGTAAHGGIRLWDKRMTRCSQLLFVRSDLRSPVYSLDFDACELFAALDRCVTGFDFSSTSQNPIRELSVYSCC